MVKEMRIFVDYLKKKGLKLTGQRRKTLELFLKAERHLSVDDLYDIARKRYPDIGRATIFRTMKLLCEAGIAREVDLGDKKVRYEPKYGHQHHDHLVCVKCGRFIEVLDPEIERLQAQLCRREAFLPQRHKMDIFGICKRCNSKIRR